MFENEFVKDHQPAKVDTKNEGDESNVINDFPEYSTEHLPMPQGLIQNYIKGKTAKKNSNQCEFITYLNAPNLHSSSKCEIYQLNVKYVEG